MEKQKGVIITLTGISGVGKTTIAKLLAQQYDFRQSISFTTRQQRDGELHGVDYMFTTKMDFLNKLSDGFFLEHVENFGNLYGTSYEHITDLVESHGKVVMCINENGYLKARECWGDIVHGVYLLPPSLDELKMRVEQRKVKDERINGLCAEYERILASGVVYDSKIEQSSPENMCEEILKCVKEKSLRS